MLYTGTPFVVTAGPLQQALVEVQPQSIAPGAVARVYVSAWQTVEHSTPHLYLLPQGQTMDKATDLASGTKDFGTPTVTDYGFDVTIPAQTPLGTYVVVAQGDCGSGTCLERGQSTAFSVAPPAPPAQSSPPGLFARLAASPLASLGVIGALLALILAFFIIVPPARRRLRARSLAATRQANGRSGARQWLYDDAPPAGYRAPGHRQGPDSRTMGTRSGSRHDSRRFDDSRDYGD
jgi:hypothetical protein